MRDHAIMTAWKTKWDASTIPQSITGGLHESPILKSAYPSPPYATLKCSPVELLPSAGGGEIDKRRVMLTIYHRDKSLLVAAMTAVDEEFTGAESAQALTIAGADWMQTQKRFGMSDRIERADKVASETVWKGTLEWTVWSSWE